ncbi:uncharacterized protein T069G_10915 [Trichoderma breve]|uniref:N2227-like protein n=1 Tax=Trichoderma breve TaxID=2034170 RepID=A0A9W9B3K2_9HYPO|nr:uncharacterized protein T069G_10915 [Trichoderma breve]KAJ4855357.1 hypothetical protein T069G_10915 [Trichoderma breve]
MKASIDRIVEIHQVFVTYEEQVVASDIDSPHRSAEKKQLLKRMSKFYGSWNNLHPRHRLLEALHGFYRYKEKNLPELERWKTLYDNASPQQKMLLEDTVQYSQKFASVANLITANHELCQEVLQSALEFYEIHPSELEQFVRDRESHGHTADRVSVSQGLKHLVRDWSDEGDVERIQAFPIILRSLHNLFPNRENQRVRILLPGSGLGRLGHEIAALRGFEVTNNEWSMYMNTLYRFIEKQKDMNNRKVHPFVDSWSHHSTSANMMRGVLFPDKYINSNDVLLVEGDFTTILKGHGKFDAIVTHFFIDTARNLMAYLDTIHRLLKPGGFWINYGPLLYGSGPFVQLSLDELMQVIVAKGFHLVNSPSQEALHADIRNTTLQDIPVWSVEATYGFDARALVKNAYLAQFWIAMKI